MRWLTTVKLNEQGAVHLSAALTALFPVGAVVAESYSAVDPARLLDVEATFVSAAVLERQQEFAAGRLCARRALRELGIENFALRMAPDRQPIWPAQAVGSITHTKGFCAAAVAPRAYFQGVGLDSEIVGDVGEHLWRRICTPGELALLQGLPEPARARAATLIFAAKEAFYKCQYPLVGERLNFTDVTIEADFASESGPFTVVPMRALAVTAHFEGPIAGRFIFHRAFVTTALGLPAITTPAQ